jgi:TonB family protein
MSHVMETHLIVVYWVLLSCLLATHPVVAKEPKANQELSGEDVKKALIESPTPPYPTAYRARRLEGSGSYWLHFNAKTGRVDAVKIVQSTGHAELDNVAVSTFYRWRSRPGELDHAIIPATFTLDHPHRGVGAHSY